MMVSLSRPMQQLTKLTWIFPCKSQKIEKTLCVLQMAEGKDASVGISVCMDHLHSSTGPYPASSHFLHLDGKPHLCVEDTCTT
jgi:hypothetical protein